MLIVRIILLLVFLLPINRLAIGESQPSVSISAQQNNQYPTKSSKETSNKNENNSEFLKSLSKEVSPKTQNQNITNTGNQEHYWYDTFLDNTTNWLLVLFNFLLFVVTALLVFYNCRLWKTTEDSVQVAKNSLNTTRRAYVFLKDIEVRETQGRGTMSALMGQMRWQLFPRWQNSGDTPTRNLTISVGCKVSDRELPDNFPFPYTNEELSNECNDSYNTQRNIPMVIGPKTTIITVPLIISETHEDIARIMSDYLSIYVWGEAKYIDVFDATLTHCTRFFVKLSFPEKFIEQPLLIYYERYTCADEDCNKQP